jgi:diacylglycerol kinase (ATP)
MKKRITLIIHGHRKLSKETIETVALMEMDPMLLVKQKRTKGPGDAVELARDAVSKSDYIIAIGGDGTCNEVINGIMLEPTADIVFGVIPNGTGNDFVRNLPPFSPHGFVSAIVDKKHQAIDIGRINFMQESRYFLNVADIGFGAKVIETMNKQRNSGIGGKLSYNLAILRSFFTYRKPNLEVRDGDFHFEGKSLMIVFSNGTTFGHGLCIAPDARLNSGELEMAIIGNVSLTEYGRNLGNLKTGKKISHPEVIYRTFKKLTVKTIEKNLCVETDGEIAGRSSIEVEVVPHAIWLVC